MQLNWFFKKNSLVSGNAAPEMNNLAALDAIHSGSNQTNHSGDNSSSEGSSIAQTEADAETDVARWKRLYAANAIDATDALHVRPKSNPIKLT